MIKLESKEACVSLHILHLIFTHSTHCVCQTQCREELVDGIDFHRSIYLYNFKDPILWNYLSDSNEIYTHYRRGCVEFIYQFSSELNFGYKCGNGKF